MFHHVFVSSFEREKGRSFSVCERNDFVFALTYQKRPRTTDKTAEPSNKRSERDGKEVGKERQSLVETYKEKTEEVARKKQRLQELQSRLESVRKTDADHTLKQLTERWRRAIVDCLQAFHDHEQCPVNPDTGERLSLSVLAQNLVECDLDLLGVELDDD